jgi:hypothetical protein
VLIIAKIGKIGVSCYNIAKLCLSLSPHKGCYSFTVRERFNEMAGQSQNAVERLAEIKPIEPDTGNAETGNTEIS